MHRGYRIYARTLENIIWVRKDLKNNRLAFSFEILMRSIYKSNQSVDIKVDIIVKLIYKDGRRSCMEAEIGSGNTCHCCIMRWQAFYFYGMMIDKL